MKKTILGFLILLTTFYCSKPNKENLLNQVDYFKVSECLKSCYLDSMGLRNAKIKDENLYAKLSYIVDCSWKEALLESVLLKNDTLTLNLSKPAQQVVHIKKDTISKNPLKVKTSEVTENTYLNEGCLCNFDFEIAIRDFDKTPSTIRVFSEIEKKYWDNNLDDLLEELKENEITIE